jgi:pimeloyl-ACP methyl ester carboxylesterase
MPKSQSCESRLRAESRDIALRMVRAIRPGRNEHPEHRGVFSAEEEYEEVPTRVIRGVARIAGANIKYTREAPLHEEDIKDPIPALIAHGWGGPELAYQELREEIAKRGKPAITYNSPRSMGWRNDLNPVHLFQVSKFSSQAAWGVIREVMTEHGDELVDAYGHSLGGQTAVNVTIHKPEHVRGVILDGSCGLDFHTLQEMISRTGEFAKEELWPALGRLALNSDPRIGAQLAHYIFRHPPRTFAEGLDAGATNLHRRLHQLGELGKFRAAIQSPGDIYFPLAAVERDSRHLFDAFHKREDPSSNHLAPQLDPAGTAEAIIYLLDGIHPKPQSELPILDIAA